MLYTFQLIQTAKKSGGDKYECVDDPSFIIYFPQRISRIDGNIKDEIEIEIE